MSLRMLENCEVQLMGIIILEVTIPIKVCGNATPPQSTHLKLCTV